MSKFQITNIQFFDLTFTNQVSEFEFEEVKSYSANIAINDDFIIQLSGTQHGCDWDIPHSREMSWNDPEKQNFACENYELNEVIAFLEGEGVENNFDWLKENSHEDY